MRLEYIPTTWFKAEVQKILTRYLDPKQYDFFFFGSRVKGNNFRRADIDIGIMGKKPISAKAKLAIQEELDELPLLYKIDLVDFNTVTPGFKKEALKYTETI